VKAFGGPGDDHLDGGAGRDELNGGGGHDTLLGGAHSDYLEDGDVKRDRDTLDGGGGGFDTVVYRSRTQPVTVDLVEGIGGEEGERDRVTHVENADGGSGPDRLVGTDSGTWLKGGDGNDTLIGGDSKPADGNYLFAGRGRDRLVGGDGFDQLNPGPGRDRISCGAGPDHVFDPVRGELLPGGCDVSHWSEVFGSEGYTSVVFGPHPVAVRRRAAVFELDCPYSDDDDGEFSPCDGTLTLRRGRLGGGRVLGRASFVFAEYPGEGTRRVRVRLTRRGRALARRRHGVVSTATIDGFRVPFDWTIRLKR